MKRYAIGSRIYISGRFVGEIMGYGSVENETYLVDCGSDGWNDYRLAITSRARLDTPRCEVEPPKCDSYWASRVSGLDS